MPTRKEIIEKSLAPKDLSDSQTQAEILHPAPVEVKLGGKPVRLYPLSAYDVRALTGFAAGIFMEGGLEALRLMPVITRPQNAAQALSFLARATFATPKDADTASKKQVARVFDELNEATGGPRGAYELALAFVAQCDQNHVQEFAEALADDEDDEDDGKKEA